MGKDSLFILISIAVILALSFVDAFKKDSQTQT